MRKLRENYKLVGLRKRAGELSYSSKMARGRPCGRRAEMRYIIARIRSSRIENLLSTKPRDYAVL